MPENLINMRDATPEERSNFFSAAFKVKGGLDDAEFFLRTRKAMIADADEIAVINARLADVQAELAKVKAEIEAARGEQFQLRPPTGNDVDKLAEITRQMDTLIANSNTAQQMLALVTKVLTEWSKTRP